MDIVFLAVLAAGVAMLIFREAIADVVIKAFDRKPKQILHLELEQRLSDIESMNAAEAMDEARLLVESKATAGKADTFRWDSLPEKPAFLNWFFERYQLLSFNGDDRTISLEMIRLVTFCGKRFLLFGEDEPGEKWYAVSLDDSMPGVYSVYKQNEDAYEFEPDDYDEFEFEASSVEKFLLTLCLLSEDPLGSGQDQPGTNQ